MGFRSGESFSFVKTLWDAEYFWPRAGRDQCQNPKVLSQFYISELKKKTQKQRVAV